MPSYTQQVVTDDGVVWCLLFAGQRAIGCSGAERFNSNLLAVRQRPSR
jgi:hypothetical protein